MNVQRSSGSLRAIGKASNGIVIREGMKPQCRSIAVEGKGKNVMLNDCVASKNFDEDRNKELSILEPTVPEDFILRVNNFAEVLDLKKDQNVEKNVSSMEDRNMDNNVMMDAGYLKNAEVPLIMKESLSDSVIQGNKNEIAEAWSKPKHIKISFNKDQVEFTDDGMQ
ncbi:hypothetical protein MA16_Dca026618 [Dendrobium catenatum]|uniref:Uncharacterized protein n=1 Tax=Dendrobium catenatum TaxID=906689 RepID=A0A2I0VI87_9ASPA|nr:hypothetical protein MA16_Dca026618 [Dendrobium catenatum]